MEGLPYVNKLKSPEEQVWKVWLLPFEASWIRRQQDLHHILDSNAMQA